MNNEFKVIEDGNEVTYEIVKLCKNNDNNYIIYRDDKDYYASRYTIYDNKIQLDEIETNNEWDFIDMELKKINE